MLGLIIFGWIIWTSVGVIAWAICMGAITGELEDRPNSSCPKWYGNVNCLRFSLMFILFSLPFGPISILIAIIVSICAIWSSTISVVWNKLITFMTDGDITIEETILQRLESFAVAFLNKFMSPYSPPQAPPQASSQAPDKVERKEVL